mmetsp:Transcript_20675/g.48332  ORF Transcript_20675/g.48332 Transcript_20675/m.48332 type:complete len:202 (-) Transcript_20675:1632-2237(-)
MKVVRGLSMYPLALGDTAYPTRATGEVDDGGWSRVGDGERGLRSFWMSSTDAVGTCQLVNPACRNTPTGAESCPAQSFFALDLAFGWWAGGCSSPGICSSKSFPVRFCSTLCLLASLRAEPSADTSARADTIPEGDSVAMGAGRGGMGSSLTARGDDRIGGALDGTLLSSGEWLGVCSGVRETRGCLLLAVGVATGVPGPA